MEVPAINNCTFCGSTAHVIYDYFPYVACDKCGAWGPEGEGVVNSVARWNLGQVYKNLIIRSIKTYEQKN